MVDWNAGMGGATPPLQKKTKMKEEPSETTSADKSTDDKVYSLAHSVKGREEEIGLKRQDRQ